MIDWDIIKAMGVVYVIIATMITGVSYSISLMSNISFEGFWNVGLFVSSVYWGVVFLISIFEN